MNSKPARRQSLVNKPSQPNKLRRRESIPADPPPVTGALEPAAPLVPVRRHEPLSREQGILAFNERVLSMAETMVR